MAGPVGLSSGLLTGLFGTGGPPLVLYYQLSGADKAAFRGNLMAIFLLMTLVRVPSYAGMGLITAPLFSKYPSCSLPRSFRYPCASRNSA